MNASKIDLRKAENSLYAAKVMNLWGCLMKNIKYINLIEVKQLPHKATTTSVDKK